MALVKLWVRLLAVRGSKRRVELRHCAWVHGACGAAWRHVEAVQGLRVDVLLRARHQARLLREAHPAHRVVFLQQHAVGRGGPAVHAGSSSHGL